MQIKHAFAILKAEMESLKHVEEGGLLVPWDWSGTPEFFKFARGRDDPAYPARGMHNIARDNPDIADLVKTDEQWQALQDFFFVFNSAGYDVPLLYSLSANREKNEHRLGASIFASYVRILFTRAKQHRAIDAYLREMNVSPAQVYAARRRPYPPSRNNKGDKAPQISASIAVHTAGSAFLTHFFGPDSVGLDGVDQETEDLCKALITASWARINVRCRVALPRAKKALEEKNEARKAVFDSQDKTPIERAELVNCWAKAVAQHRKLTEWMSSNAQVAQMDEEQAEINNFIRQVKDGKIRSLSLKGLEKVFFGMNDPDIIARLEDTYAEAFEDLLEEPDDEEDPDMMMMFDDAGELGVLEYKDKDISQLRSLLGLDGKDQPPAVFPFFNAWISDVGKLPSDIHNFENIAWDDTELAEAHCDKLRPLRPQWHQYIALAAIVKQFFSGQNVLLADGVGLGKTLECFMAMAYMRHLRVLGGKKPPVKPPIVTQGKCDRWGWNRRDSNYVPTGHILVAVPGMLVRQWEEESKRFLDNRFWNVLVYPTQKKLLPGFWQKWDQMMDGRSEDSKRDMTTILLVSFSTLRAESKIALVPNIPKINLVDRRIGPKVLHPGSTLFNKEWALVIFDEAQHLRGESPLLRSAHALRVKSASMILATATPLHNNEKDLVYLGCAMDCPGADDLVNLGDSLQVDVRRFQQAKKNMVREERQGRHDRGAAIMEGLMSEHPIEREKANLRLAYVRQMRACFQNTVIRRTRRSKDYDGNPISDLEEREDVDFCVHMREDERLAFAGIVERMSAQINGQANIASLPTKVFFTEYRRGIANVRFAQRSAPSLWDDEKHYRRDNSTKWRMIFKLIHYLLKSDAEPFPFYDTRAREMVFPNKLTEHDAKSKIVLYFEFTSLLDVLLQACKFEGLEVLCATGRSPTKKRTDAILKFMTDPNSRILILSSIGNAGLNLHAARFMIFMDCVWSGQAEEQIIGRIHRQPNKQKVIVYHPRVAGTSDIVLRQFARSKEKLLEQFLGESDFVEESRESVLIGGRLDRRKEMDELEEESDTSEDEMKVEEDLREEKGANRAAAKKGPNGEKRCRTSHKGKGGSDQKRKRVKTEN